MPKIIMPKNKTGNSKFLKMYNEAVILDMIRLHGALSKSELSRITGLSPTAAGMIASGLLEKGYLQERGEGESSGGRKPVLLELAPRSYYSVGVDMDVGCIRAVLMDITGALVCELTRPMPDPPLFEEAEAIVRDMVAGVLDEHSVAKDRLLGIGISVPGIVDMETGRIVLAPNLGWENVNFGICMGQPPGIPVFVENEAMSSAICENWVGSCKGINNFVCINIKSGVGSGIFADGRLYRGAGGSAGEVGHIAVDENGPRCGCGNYGCLETLVSSSRIVEKARKLAKQGASPGLSALQDIGEIDLDMLVKASKEGDEAAKAILIESARYLGIAVSYIVNTLNPSKVVIGKDFTRYADVVIDYLRSIVYCKALKTHASKVEIVSSPIGDRASALGAAIIPLKALFGK